MARALRVIAVALLLLAVVAAATGGVRIEIGGVRLSATSAGRVAFQASLCWLTATLLALAAPPADGSGRARRVRWAIVAVLLGAIADSHPRRVGDGAEYLAMALNLGALRPPALSADDVTAAEAVFDGSAGFEGVRLPPGRPGRDGRQDTHHFWLYSLLAAPGVAVARAVGVHVNHAFTLVNGLLVLGLAWWLVQRGQLLAAILVATGPMLWWVDKAHAEAFLSVTIAVALLVTDHRPGVAVLAAGLAAAQNPAGLVVLAVVGAAIGFRYWSDRGAKVEHHGPAERSARRPILIAGGVALLVACAAPLYYLWHLGTWTPLTASVAVGVPPLRAFLTPLLDLNLGLLWHAPVLMALSVAGFLAADTRTRVVQALVTVAMLGVFAQVSNVNHGGTPGMSRYALWLLAAWTPLVVRGAEQARRAAPAVFIAIVVASVATTWFLFRPSMADRAGASPNALASFVWHRLPSLENPLPEVFAERLSGLDGLPPMPIATPGCEKVLTRGDGLDATWPFPCEPRPTGDECRIRAALCYVNGSAVVVVPVTMPAAAAPSPQAWSARDRHGLDAWLAALGAGARHQRSTAPLQRIASLDDTLWSYVVEGERGSLAWVRARPDAVMPVLDANLQRPSRVEMRRAAEPAASTEAPTVVDLPAGRHAIRLPRDELVVVVIAETNADR